MANRVVLGAFDGDTVLRVSLPGLNVLNSALTPDQLAFDSRWPNAGNLMMTGTFDLGKEGEGTQSRTVIFPEPFPTLPLIVMTATIQDGSSHYPTGSVVTVPMIADGGMLNSVQVFLDRFICRYYGYNFGTMTFNYNVYGNLYG